MDKDDDDEDGEDQNTLQATKVLQLLRRLLSEHEVRLTVDLLDALSHSPLSQARVVLSSRAFQQSLDTFAEKQRSAGLAGAAGLRLLEELPVAWNALRPQAGSIDSMPSTQATLSAPQPRSSSHEVPAIVLSRPGSPGTSKASNGEPMRLEDVDTLSDILGEVQIPPSLPPGAITTTGEPPLTLKAGTETDSSSGFDTDDSSSLKSEPLGMKAVVPAFMDGGGAQTPDSKLRAYSPSPERRKSWFGGLAAAAPSILSNSGSLVVVGQGEYGGRRNSFRETRRRVSGEAKLASYGFNGKPGKDTKSAPEGEVLLTCPACPTPSPPPEPSATSPPHLPGGVPQPLEHGGSVLRPLSAPPPAPAAAPKQRPSVEKQPQQQQQQQQQQQKPAHGHGSLQRQRSSAGFLNVGKRKSEGASRLNGEHQGSAGELNHSSSGNARSIFQPFAKSSGTYGSFVSRKSVEGTEGEDSQASGPRLHALRRADSKVSLGGDMDDFFHDDSEDEFECCVRWGDDLDDLTPKEVSWLAVPSNRWISHPNSAKRAMWDITMLLFIVSECITLPLRLCFLIEMPEVWTWGLTTFFAIDIPLNFNTGFFYKSVLIMRTSFISRTYLRTWFILDFASTFPWEEAFQGFVVAGGQATFLRLAKLGKLMRCLRLLRLMKIGRLLSRFQDIAFFNSYSVSFGLSLAKMLFIFGMLCHWAACIWGAIGDPEMMDDASQGDLPHLVEECVPGGPCENGVWGTPWRHRYGMDNFDVPTQYLAALHFATGLVTGSELALQPAFWAERVFTVVVMIIGLFICAAILSQVLVMINRLAERDIERKEQVIAMREFMINRKVCPELQAKVRRYLESQAETKRGQGNAEVLNLLNESLKAEVIIYLNRRVISKHPFFERFTELAMRKICVASTTFFYTTGENVLEKGQLADSCHFIVRGKLKVDKAKDNKCVYLEAGSWLGDKCLFIQTRRTHTVVTVTLAEVLCVLREHVEMLCHEIPFLSAHYEAFRKRICAGENLLLCPYCKKVGHSEEDCPQKKSEVKNTQEAPSPKTGVLDRMRTSFVGGRASFVGGRASVLSRVVADAKAQKSPDHSNEDSGSEGGGDAGRRTTHMDCKATIKESLRSGSEGSTG